MKSKVRITKETYVWTNETEEGVFHYRDGKLHREDGPAVEYADGSKHWMMNGELHREDGPAAEMHNGTKQYWLNGKMHRYDGPAVECADGSKHWMLNGFHHREDGPAFEGATGETQWFLNDIELTEEEFKHWLEKRKLNEKLQSSLQTKPTEKRSKI